MPTIKNRMPGDVAVASVEIEGVKHDIMLAKHDADQLHANIVEALIDGCVEIDMPYKCVPYLCVSEDQKS